MACLRVLTPANIIALCSIIFGVGATYAAWNVRLSSVENRVTSLEVQFRDTAKTINDMDRKIDRIMVIIDPRHGLPAPSP